MKFLNFFLLLFAKKIFSIAQLATFTTALVLLSLRVYRAVGKVPLFNATLLATAKAAEFTNDLIFLNANFLACAASLRRLARL